MSGAFLVENIDPDWVLKRGYQMKKVFAREILPNGRVRLEYEDGSSETFQKGAKLWVEWSTRDAW